MNDNGPELHEDLLEGAKSVALFLYGRSDTQAQRKVYYLIEKTNFPSFKMGSTLCARKSVLLAWIKQQEERHANDNNKLDACKPKRNA